MKTREEKEFIRCSLKIISQLERITKQKVETKVRIINRKPTLKIFQNDAHLMDIIKEEKETIIIEYFPIYINYPRGVIAKKDYEKYSVNKTQLNEYLPMHTTGEKDDWSRLWEE